MRMIVSVPLEDIDTPGVSGEYPARPVKGSAYCMRLLCRIRNRITPLEAA